MTVIAVDTETWGDITKTSVYDPTIRMSHISFYDENGWGNVFDVKIKEHEEKIRMFGEHFLANPKVTKLFWHAPFDIPVLQKYGLEVKGPVFDVKILAQIIKPLEVAHGLKFFSQKFLDVSYTEQGDLKKAMRKNNWEYGDVPLRMMYSYALLDAKCTMMLYHFLKAGLDKHDMWPVFLREMDLLRVILSMESRGVQIDRDECEMQIKVADSKLRELKTDIRRFTHSSFNPNSSAQVIEAIYDDDHKPTRFTKRGNPSVDSLALLQCGTDLSRAIGSYRSVCKARDTYLGNVLSRIDSGGLLHAGFNQTAARTGRFSVSGPSLQNIPRAGPGVLGGMRRIFVGRPQRRLVCIDYNQLELRLTAHFANEESMIAAINRGEDLHSLACKQTFNIDEDHPEWKVRRYLAKNMNFAVNYGAGPEKYCESILKDTGGKVVITPEVAKEYINAWKKSHPGVLAWSNQLISEAALTGGIRNYYGRFLPLAPGESYKVVNYFIQSTAADLLKERMLLCWKSLRGKETDLILTIHDELIFDMPSAEKALISELKKIMEELHEFKVPLTCSIEMGKSWGTKKKYKHE